MSRPTRDDLIADLVRYGMGCIPQLPCGTCYQLDGDTHIFSHNSHGVRAGPGLRADLHKLLGGFADRFDRIADSIDCHNDRPFKFDRQLVHFSLTLGVGFGACFGLKRFGTLAFSLYFDPALLFLFVKIGTGMGKGMGIVD